MVVMCYAVQFVFGEEVEGHEGFGEGWVRGPVGKGHEGCEAELKGGDFLCEGAVAARGWGHGG